ncbi:MAG: putative PurR-regulated permease PerM [Sediminicola sp.]|jgi:predicted PurR-regulated permease PerM|tara:strand:+ start:3815 stop:4873 length:1059 start_codon:yes stop_codon:yes gene_type:complete
MKSLKQNITIDNFIKIVVLTAILFWSFNIIEPFILLMVWAIIVAVAIYPIHQKIIRVFKGKKKGLVTSLFIIFLLALIILPTISVTQSIVDTSKEIYHNFEEGSLKIPPPNESVKEWPLVGEKLYGVWYKANTDAESFIKENPEEVKGSLGWLFDSFKGLMGSVMLSLIALIIAGVFMSSAEGGYKTGVKFMERLKEGRGVALMEMCTNTIRSVVKGILLVAIIQAILAYAGFAMIGLSSMAGILAILILLAAIIQIPVTLVAIPVIVYVFSFAETTPAIIFAIYMIVVSLLDNVLKPMLLAKGLQTPMIIILMGAIGGMMYQGILGLFIGPVVLAILHELYTTWVNQTAEA